MKKYFQVSFLKKGVVILIFVLGILPCSIMTQTTNKFDDNAIAKKTADMLSAQYKKTMDLGSIVSEMASSDTARGIRSSNILTEVGFNPNLVNSLDDSTLISIYGTFMDTYFIGYVYNIFANGCDREIDGFPRVVISVLNKSRLGKIVIQRKQEGDIDNSPIINTKAELEEFTRLQSDVSHALRNQLPSNPFDSPVYLQRFPRDESVVEKVSITDGEILGLHDDIVVYEIRRDFFVWYLVKEENSMKLLHIGVIE